MKVEELKNNKLTRKFKIHIPFNEIQLKVEEKILEVAKSFKIPGFRKGKVPLSIVKQRVIKEETGRQIQKKIFFLVKELVKIKNIALYSKPNIDILSFNKDSGLLVNIIFKMAPNIPLIKWDDINVNKINIKISDQEVYKTKNNLLKEFRKFNRLKKIRNTRLGDKVIVNIKTKIDGECFYKDNINNIEVIIGDNAFLFDFENSLLGSLIDEEKKFKIIFREGAQGNKISNNQIYFKVKIIALEELENVVCISDEMLKKIGVKSEFDLDNLIKQKLIFDFVSTVRLKIKKDIYDIIDRKYKFDLPEILVEKDFNMIWKEVEMNRDKIKKFKNKSKEEIKAECREISERRVKLGFIISDIANKNSITVNNEELTKIILLKANQNPQIKDKILEYYKDPNNLEKFKGPILEERVFDFILSKVNMIDIDMTIDDFLKNIVYQVKK